MSADLTAGAHTLPRQFVRRMGPPLASVNTRSDPARSSDAATRRRARARQQGPGMSSGPYRPQSTGRTVPHRRHGQTSATVHARQGPASGRGSSGLEVRRSDGSKPSEAQRAGRIVEPHRQGAAAQHRPGSTPRAQRGDACALHPLPHPEPDPPRTRASDPTAVVDGLALLDVPSECGTLRPYWVLP